MTIVIAIPQTKDQIRESIRNRARKAALRYKQNRSKYKGKSKKQNPFDAVVYPEEHTQWNAYFIQALKTKTTKG